jgi:REase_MTES_1575
MGRFSKDPASSRNASRQRVNDTFRRAFDDRKSADKMVEFFVERALEEEHKEREVTDPNFEQVWEIFVRATTTRASNAIFALAESPVERLFFGSMLLHLIRQTNGGFTFSPPFGDTVDDLKRFDDNLGFLDKAWADFGAQGTAKSLDAFNREIDERGRRAGIHPDSIEFTQNIFFMYTFLPWLRGALHFTPQAVFKHLLDGRDCRVDLLVWIPEQPTFRFVVECDGFEYHTSKDAFVNDRRRDRALNAAGFEVLRWSGSEIHKDPADAGYEFVMRLLDCQEALRPKNTGDSDHLLN